MMQTMFRFRPHRVNLDSPGVAKVLGDCEADILRALWNVPNGSVQDVRAALLDESGPVCE